MNKKFKKTAQYQLTKRFILILCGVLFFINVLFLLISLHFTYAIVADEAYSLISNISMQEEKEILWNIELDNYLAMENDSVVRIIYDDGEIVYSSNGALVFEEANQERGLRLFKNIVITSSGLYYSVTREFNGVQLDILYNANDLMTLTGGFLAINLGLNIVALIVGSICIYVSVSKWSKKMTKMTNEIINIDQREQGVLTVPEEPLEIQEVASAFNRLLTEQQAAILREKQFVTDASHELKTPLAAIIGHVQLIKRRGRQYPEVIPPSIGFIEKEAKRLEKMSNQLLKMDRVTSKKSETIAISELLFYEIEKLQVIAPQEFRCRIQESLFLVGEKNDYQQIFQNLLENAVKYSESKTVIEVLLQQTPTGIIFTVKDQGFGIPDDEKTAIFERFYRVDNSRSSNIEGSGIGLSIVKKLVDKYHGTIVVEDNLPQGASFQIVFNQSLEKNTPTKKI